MKFYSLEGLDSNVLQIITIYLFYFCFSPLLYFLFFIFFPFLERKGCGARRGRAQIPARRLPALRRRCAGRSGGGCSERGRAGPRATRSRSGPAAGGCGVCARPAAGRPRRELDGGTALLRARLGTFTRSLWRCRGGEGEGCCALGWPFAPVAVS